MSKIKIMSDSTADIPKKISEELDITILPLTIIDGDKEYLDGVTMNPCEFYELLENCDKIPSSSRVTPGLFTEQYEKAWKDGYTHLMYVCLNSKGSSTYNGACLELEDFYEENPDAVNEIKIDIIDSQTYSGAYGYAAIQAAQMAKEGKEYEEIADAVRNWLQNAKILLVPANLRFVKKSGRVSAASAFVGDALGLKPVITFEDGESKVIAKIRGDKKVVPELLKMIEADRKPGTPYLIAKGKNPDWADQLSRKATEAFGEEPKYEFNLGCIISINTGPDFVGVVYYKF